MVVRSVLREADRWLGPDQALANHFVLLDYLLLLQLGERTTYALIVTAQIPWQPTPISTAVDGWMWLVRRQLLLL